MAYNWRYFSSYRLNKDELEKYLKRKFGDWNFYIEQLTGGERYKFWIERDLTPAEEDEIMDLRWKG